MSAAPCVGIGDPQSCALAVRNHVSTLIADSNSLTCQCFLLRLTKGLDQSAGSRVLEAASAGLESNLVVCPPDFLNSRENALVFWTVAILVFAVWEDPRGIAAGFLRVLRTVVQTKLLFLFGSTALYCVLIVLAGMELGLWHTHSVKPTIYWFFGTAIVLTGYAVTHSPGSPGFLLGVLKRVVAVTILVDFIVNLYVLPFAVEFVLVFLALLFVGLEVVVRRDPAADPRVRKFVDWVLAYIGLFYLGYFLIKALGNLDSFLTRENAEDFLVGPALTVALIPFLYAVAWVSQREQRTLRERPRRLRQHRSTS
jgi:hypothetical protein